MELQEFLLKELQKKFRANATIRAIEDKIEKIAEQITFIKYKDDILFADGLEFELVKVNASLSHRDGSLTLGKVDLELGYFCKSKLPKAKREKLKDAKDIFIKEGYMPWNNYNVALWRNIRYSIEIEKVLSRNINLELRFPH